jgi:spermidine/putrescine transport system substrate-binding protein
MIKTVFFRICISCFWIALILGILYFPTLSFLPKNKKTINVFAWGDIVDLDVVAEFEKLSGIKVNLSFYASNEELLVKIKATKGEGYDIIIPSDYCVDILAKQRLLKKIEKSRLDFYDNLNPKLLNHHFDPNNIYSIPFEWELFVLGIDKNFFETPPLPSWKLIFDTKNIDYHITMPNDPIITFSIVSYYLYGKTQTITEEMLNNCTKLLIEQKKWVNAFADARADYFLATKNSGVVLCSTPYIWRSMKKFPFISYLIPKEGTFITIENICIPSTSTKEKLAYKFINHLYTKKSMQQHYNTYGTFPATLNALKELQLNEKEYGLMAMTLPELPPLHFIKIGTDQKNFRNAWIRIKTKFPSQK